MSELKNAHGSLLNFVSSLAEQFSIEAVNLDAIADEVDLPTTDFIGLDSFSMASGNDSRPLATVAGMITLGIRNDTNNMRLMDFLDKVYSCLQPENGLPFFSLETGEQLGDMKLMGTTRVMPVTRLQTLAMQSITFQAALQYVE